ncbi:hypothetical protein Hanom_Chr01g00007321 [Helianthus anomalus]
MAPRTSFKLKNKCNSRIECVPANRNRTRPPFDQNSCFANPTPVADGPDPVADGFPKFLLPLTG